MAKYEPKPGSSQYSSRIIGRTFSYLIERAIDNPPSARSIYLGAARFGALAVSGCVLYYAYNRNWRFKQLGVDCKSLLRARGQEVPDRPW